MNMDERWEFIRQSTESLHQTTLELTNSIREMREHAKEQDGRIGQILDLMHDLGQIVKRHEERLDNLEDGGTR
jgi:methyl-accepting chemotaxis protein